MARSFKDFYPLLGVTAGSSAANTTGTVSGNIYDLSGFEGVVFLATITATATNNGLLAKGGSATASMSHLAGTWTTGHTTQLELEVYRPIHRYIQPNLVLGTSAAYGPIFAFGIGSKAVPASNATTVTSKRVVHPGTGTATSS